MHTYLSCGMSDESLANVEMDQPAVVEEEVFGPTEVFGPVLSSMNSWLENLHTNSIVHSTQLSDKLKDQTSVLSDIRTSLSEIHMTLRSISAKMTKNDSSPIFQRNDSSRISDVIVTTPSNPSYKRASSSVAEHRITPKRTQKTCIFCESPLHGPKACLIRSIRVRKEILKAKYICQICSTHLPHSNHDANVLRFAAETSPVEVLIMTCGRALETVLSMLDSLSFL